MPTIPLPFRRSSSAAARWRSGRGWCACRAWARSRPGSGASPWPGRKLATLVAFAAFFFAADLAAWHAGIHMTKLGNATLFGNVSSFGFAAWGLWLARRWPTRLQALALGLAAAGAALLMGSSAELSMRHVTGDLLALGAGLLYTGYLIA